jgi:transcriptional regulator with XRE-family HTH domain
LTVPTRSKQTTVEGIGERLKRLRLERGFSQRDLSSPGVSYAYISRIEAGARTPSVKALRMLAAKLGVSVEYLETGRDLRDTDERELRLADAELRIRLDSDTAEAETALTAVLAEAEAAGDHLAASRALIALGFAAAHRGNHLDAVERLEDALARRPVAAREQADVYATLGQSYAALGAPERAVKIFERCLSEAKEQDADDSSLQVRFATLLSYALSDAGEHKRATEVVRDALRRAQPDDPHTRIRLYWSIARSAGLDGRHSEALRSIRKAIALLEVTDDTAQLARGCILAAGIEAEDGHLDQARELVERARALLGRQPEPRDKGMLRMVEAQCAILESDGNRASALARDALKILGDYHGGEHGEAVWTLARGLALEGDEAGANDAYKRAVDLLTVHRRRHDATRCTNEWRSFLRKQGRTEEAERTFPSAG